MGGIPDRPTQTTSTLKPCFHMANMTAGRALNDHSYHKGIGHAAMQVIEAIGHFRVALNLIMKARLSAKFLL